MELEELKESLTLASKNLSKFESENPETPDSQKK
jgi:hypothetical protein